MEIYRFVLCCVLFTAAASLSIPDYFQKYNDDNLLEIAESDSCRCLNGKCVTNNKGNTKCVCKPGYALQNEFTCEPCDCGSKGKCIFIQNLKSRDDITYEKKCVCDVGSAEKDGKCIDCYCGDNSACEFNGEEKNCYCIEGYSEKDGVCTKCDCGFYGKCEFVQENKTCECDEGYLEYNGVCEECDCGQNSVDCSFTNGVKDCKCKDKFSDKSGICEECDCGPFGLSCSFENNEAKCVCSEGYVQKNNSCEVSCEGDSGCSNGGKCVDQFCDCLNGTSGDLCKTVPECSIKNCGRDAKCAYSVERRSAVCVCDDERYSFDDTDRTCKRGCTVEDECNNGGTCVSKGFNRFCDCLPGTEGDLCETVDDCKEGRTNCSSDARCVFDVQKLKAACECSDNRTRYDVLSDECKLTCYEDATCYNGGLCMHRGDYLFCDCKVGTSGNLCEIVDDCQRGVCGYTNEVECFYDLAKEAAACRCENPDRLFDPASKTCKTCNCGRNAISCTYENGSKVCVCRDGSDVRNGTCQRTCGDDSGCSNGAKCVDRFCDCLEGTSGDLCEVTDCRVKVAQIII